MNPKFFKSQSELRNWFAKNQKTSTEIWIGFYKKGSGKASVAYIEAVDEALCFGWIDGIRKKVDEISYANRFTPRKPKSNWSRKNIENVERLIKSKKMRASGLKQVALAREDGRIP